MTANNLSSSIHPKYEHRAEFLRWLLSGPDSSTERLTHARHRWQQNTAPLDPKAVANLLRSTPATLADFGIYPESDDPAQPSDLDPARNLDGPWWSQLRKCLEKAAQAEEGLTIFRAMAYALEGKSMALCLPVMKAALSHPWRLQAIEAAPAFFKTQRTQRDNSVVNGEPYERAANAFAVLAYIEPMEGFNAEAVRAAIAALKNAEVHDNPSPEFQRTCLHAAVAYQTPNTLGEFLKEFPQHINANDCIRKRPIHFAAEAGAAANINLLIESGADPKSANEYDHTPLYLAAAHNHLEAAKALVDTNVYTTREIAYVAKSVFRKEKGDELLAYHAAVRARHAVDEAGSDEPLLRPL